MLHDLLPSVFPYTHAISIIEKEMEKQPHQPPNSRPPAKRNGSDLLWNSKNINRLQTGDSLRFQRLDSLMTQPTIVHFPYRHSIAWRTPNITSSAAIAASASFLQSIAGKDCPPVDENEIYLSDGDSTDLPVNSCTEKSTSIYPHLLFLGTGCAAPSAIRGSSGYAIFLPFCQQTSEFNTKKNNTLALFALLDCGEGCLTSLAQYIPQSLSLKQSLLSLKLIWISHSHLDHYGGLVTVITAIDDASRPKGEDVRHYSEKPIIIAPLKVLQYLDECLGCVNGVLRIEDRTGPEVLRRLFHGTTHQEFQLSSTSSGDETVREKLFGCRLRHCTTLELWQPVADLRNIPVEHCPHSYSLIIDLQYPDAESYGRRIKTFCLCYSGDCRPSTNLISACRQHRQRPDLVIHEATFDDNMKQEARSKRHCTVSEALEVVSKMDVSACFLSHFSQRYPHTSNQSKQHNPKSISSPVFICSAVDGLFLPLSERVFLSLNLLDSAITTFLDPTV
jgi:ribonuclease Z